MKINERNLCNFACSPPVDLEGWLNKRGEVNKSFQKRWFVLKGNLLFYFEKKGDKEPLGMIILEGCTIELAEDSEQYCFQIIFHGPQNRTYVLSAENQIVMESWMKALTTAGYDYMKLMVAELQRQLDELDGQKNKTPENTPTPKAPPRRTNPFNKPTNNSSTSSSQAVNGNNLSNLMASNGFSSVSGSGHGDMACSSAMAPPKQLKKAPPPPNQYQPSNQPQAHNLDDSEIKTEFSFKNLHELIGKPILDGITKRKEEQQRAEQPLIQF